MNKILPLVCGLFLAMGSMAQSDLFFSEYVEGSGNNKALEIYNPTNQTVDLSMYYIARFSNGSTDYTTGGVTQLQGTLEPYKAFVFVNGQTSTTETSPAPDPALQALADQLDHEYPAPLYMNGNDAMALLKTETGDLADALPVDLFGQIGLGSKIKSEEGWAPFTDTTIVYTIGDVEYKHTINNYIIKSTDDTGSAAYGPYWLAWSADHTLRRKYEVVEGVKANPAEFNISLEWDTVSVAAQGVDELTGETYTYRKYKDIWDDLGTHACIAAENGGNGVETLKADEIKVYPTVVSNQMITVNAKAHSIRKVTVLTNSGQTVYSKHYEGESKVNVQLPELAPGVYLVVTTTNKQNRYSSAIFVH